MKEKEKVLPLINYARFFWRILQDLKTGLTYMEKDVLTPH
jgi:hypothetical protein